MLPAPDTTLARSSSGVEDDLDRRGYVGPPESRRIYWHVVTRPSVDGWPYKLAM